MIGSDSCRFHRGKGGLRFAGILRDEILQLGTGRNEQSDGLIGILLLGLRDVDAGQLQRQGRVQHRIAAFLQFLDACAGQIVPTLGTQAPYQLQFVFCGFLSQDRPRMSQDHQHEQTNDAFHDVKNPAVWVGARG